MPCFKGACFDVEKSSIYHRHFDVYDGLPSNEIYFVYQDREKYIWICSDNGVTKFDGVEFRNYNIQDGLCFNVVFGCREDEDGDLWFYSFTGELSKYNRKSDQFECPGFNDSLALLLRGEVIKDISFYQDSIYLSTMGRCYKVYPSASGKVSVEQVIVKQNQIILFISEYNKLTVMYNVRDKSEYCTLIVKGLVNDTVNNLRLKGGLVRNDFAGTISNGICTVLFGENILEYNAFSKSHKLSRTPFYCTPRLEKCDRGYICGSYHDGLWLLEKKANKTIFTKILDGTSISSVMMDHQGGIWASSQESGLYYLPTLSAKTFSDNILSINYLSEVNPREDIIFYTTYNDGLYMLKKKDNEVYKTELLQAKEKIIYCEYNNRTVRIKCRDKIFSYSILNDRIKIKDSINSDQYCFPNNISVYNKKIHSSAYLALKICSNNIVREVLLPQKWNLGRIRTTAVTESGKILLGNAYDLFIADTVSQTISRVIYNKPFRHFSVKSILPLKGDTVAVSTNQGIFFVAGNSVIKRISVSDGLSSNTVSHIVREGNRLWTATSNGIDCIENYYGRPNISSLTYYSGANICPVNRLSLFGNFVVAGTNQGILFFDRTQFMNDRLQVTPLIKKASVNNIPIEISSDGVIELRGRGNSLKVEFTAMNFRNALHNVFRYRLTDEYNAAWHYTNDNIIIFPSISPGDYNFEIQVKNPKGYWSDNSSEINVIVHPPFWQAWWFVSGCTGVGIAGVYSFFYVRMRRLRKINDLKNKLSESKFLALGMQLNPHFVFNALNSVTAHMARNDVKATLRLLGKFARLMRAVFRNSQYAFVSLEDELNALKIYIELELIRLGHKFTYDIYVDEDIDRNECGIPSLLLQPIIENAIWHGIAPLESAGKLRLAILKENEGLKIEITDNGIGRREASRIKPQKAKEKHSLDIITERLSLLETYLSETVSLHLEDVNSTTNAGTRVTIYIPTINMANPS